MCALCGVLGGVGSLDRCRRAPRRVHAQRRSACSAGASGRTASPAPAACCNYYGLTLSDWQASSFVLSTATGKTEIVDNLGHLWAAAEKLLGRPCDPLDPDLIVRLEGSGG